MCDDQLRGRHGRIHGAQPTAKTPPDLCGVIDSEVLQQALGDTAELNIPCAITQPRFTTFKRAPNTDCATGTRCAWCVKKMTWVDSDN